MKIREIVVFILLILVLKMNAQETPPFEIGEFRYLSVMPDDCPEGYTCSSFEVNCIGSDPAKGIIAYAEHTGNRPNG